MALLFPKPGPRRSKKKEGAPSDHHTELVRSSPCAACLMLGKFNPNRSEAHHIMEGHGMALKASDFEQIPLCSMHHTRGTKGVAFHEDPGAWPWVQRDLLARSWQVWRLLRKIPQGVAVGESYGAMPVRSISPFIPEGKLIRLFRSLAPLLQTPPDEPQD